MSYLSEIREIKRRAGLMESGPSNEALSKAVQMMINEIGSGASYGFDEQMAWEFAEVEDFEHDGDPHYVISKDQELQAKFDEWKAGYASDIIHNAVYTVEYCLEERGGLGVVYRMITAPPDWYEKGGLTARNIGEYWACKKKNTLTPIGKVITRIMCTGLSPD